MADLEGWRTCKRCGYTRQIEHFRKPGNIWCNDCLDEAYKRVRVGFNKSRCTKCKRVKDRSAFFRDNTRTKGVKSWCKDCCKTLDVGRDKKKAKSVGGAVPPVKNEDYLL